VSRVLYLFLAGLARLVVRSGRAKDLEIIALRHQLAVLRRQVERPSLGDDDRSLLAAVAKALGRARRQVRRELLDRTSSGTSDSSTASWSTTSITTTPAAPTEPWASDHPPLLTNRNRSGHRRNAPS
jgi:hypothetical protein